MGEELPDGTLGGYTGICGKCGVAISVNIQGDELGMHRCLSKRGRPKKAKTVLINFRAPQTVVNEAKAKHGKRLNKSFNGWLKKKANEAS